MKHSYNLLFTLFLLVLTLVSCETNDDSSTEIPKPKFLKKKSVYYGDTNTYINTHFEYDGAKLVRSYKKSINYQGSTIFYDILKYSYEADLLVEVKIRRNVQFHNLTNVQYENKINLIYDANNKLIEGRLSNTNHVISFEEFDDGSWKKSTDILYPVIVTFLVSSENNIYKMLYNYDDNQTILEYDNKKSPFHHIDERFHVYSATKDLFFHTYGVRITNMDFCSNNLTKIQSKNPANEITNECRSYNYTYDNEGYPTHVKVNFHQAACDDGIDEIFYFYE